LDGSVDQDLIIHGCRRNCGRGFENRRGHDNRRRAHGHGRRLLVMVFLVMGFLVVGLVVLGALGRWGRRWRWRGWGWRRR
jgi:hypothetical protein